MLKSAKSFHQVMSDTDKQTLFYLHEILIIKNLNEVHQIFWMLE